MTRTKPIGTGRGSVPAELTSFVGRRRELAESRRLLSSSRLVTLTGVGGVGKTRLAMRLAAELRRTFPDGVWFVELAALQDPQLVPNTVAAALELRQMAPTVTADLADYLEDKQLLVVLDNCEHLTEACGMLVGKLLAAAPGLRIVATSRHVLGVEGEQILTVPPLATPDDEEEPAAGDLRHYESVALFLDRAKAVSPDFQVSDANRAAVVELCRRLDGIPLAIELAAVWLRTLSPAQILVRFTDRFRLLSTGRSRGPARQQTLDTAIGWSFELCSPEERLLWTRLSVFRGGFDLDAAEEVCSGTGIDRGDVLVLVASLVNKSIISRQHVSKHPTAWYQMLETIRQYGAGQLTDPDAVRELRLRHRNHYCALAAQYAAESFSPQQAEWYLRLRREHGNIRSALDFCIAEPSEAAAALDIAAPIWNFWFAGFLREGYRYLLQALELATEPTRSRAYGLWAASYLAMIAAEFDRNRAMLAECGELAERFDDDLLRARVKECQGHALIYQGQLANAIDLLEDSRDRFRTVDDPLGEFDTLVLLTAATFFLDDPRVEEFSRQALELAERHGALASKGYGLWGVGIMHWRAGRYDEGVRWLAECIRIFDSLHDLTGISFGVQALSWCVAFASPDDGAARLLGASRAVWRASGARVDETNAYGTFDDRSADVVREAIGDLRFDKAFAEGASYSLEQALALALKGEPEPETSRRAAPSQTRSEPPGGLTNRQWEIAQLVAEGLSNKEIAARLVISQRTAETHVENVLGKLGFGSRAQIGSWVAEQRAG